MPTPFDVKPQVFIDQLAKHLRDNVGDVTPPIWSSTAKSSSHRELPPQDPNWWYKRCASILRKLYVHGNVGVSRLKVEYGGRKRRGRMREHGRPSGGSAIREPIQQLEKAGLVTAVPGKGRKLTGPGKSMLDQVAAGVVKPRSPKQD